MKKITSLVLALALVLTLAPMSVRAGNDTNMQRATETGEMCHCGGRRLVSTVETREVHVSPCPEHGATCVECYRVYVAEYYHCSNPHCTDLWYGPERSYLTHIYG